MLVQLFAALALQGPQIPEPVGYVNDFAGVIPASASATLERISADVRSKSRGEIVVVTLRDLGGRSPYEIGTQIGRDWKVGARAEIGAQERNTGAIILLIPKETSSDNRGHCFVATGSGTEGFVTDAAAGEACREATPLFREQRYGDGVVLVAYRIAERYAREFNFQLDTALVAEAPVRRGPSLPPMPSGGGINPVTLLAIFIVLMILLNGIGSRGRRGRRGQRGCGGCIPLPIVIPYGGGGYRGGGGWGGGWSGGGGGFGGFGGGGGFSGGGGGSSW